MPDNINPQSVRASVKIYERLLATYPAAFRQEYGQSMKQLFRDQCRDAWGEAGRRGLIFLWLRVLADWAKTSVVEHFSNLNQTKSHFMKTLRAFSSDPRARSPFVRVFVSVFIPAIVCSLLVAMWSPRVYSSTVRIEVQKYKYTRPASNLEPGPGYSSDGAFDPYFMTTQFKIIESYSVLTNVIADLKLNQILPEQLGKPQWSMDETYTYLYKMIEVERTRMTSLIEIKVKNPSPLLAATIANKIAGAYKWEMLNQFRELREHSKNEESFYSPFVMVRDPGKVELKPFYPNRRIIVIWLLEGTLLAVAAGGIAAWLGIISRASRPSHTQAGD